MFINKIGGIMFDLLCILEINLGAYISRTRRIIKLVLQYILPTFITVIIFSSINKSINFQFKDLMINLIIINFFYIGIVHFYIQKKFFMTLDKDIIMKFIPNKASDYIITRVCMIFIKAYLPLILPSILTLGTFFVNSKLIFYLSSFLLIISTIIINVCIAIYWRYFTNTAIKTYVRVVRILFFICMLFLFILTSFYTPIYILSNYEASFRHRNARSIIELNIYILLIIMLICLLAYVIFTYTKKNLKLRARILIINREFTIRIHTNKILNKIEKFYESVYSINLSPLEKNIFYKDLKETIRKNKYTFFFISLYQFINVISVLFFNFADEINTAETSVLASKLLTSIVIGQILLSYFISKSFEMNINIENDFEVLEKYNIKFNKNSLINVKARLLSAIVFPKIYFVFYILILSSIIRLNNYLALFYLLSMIQLIFIRKTMELWRVKVLNELNSKSEVIKFISVLGILTTISLFFMVYSCTDKTNYLQGQLVLIIITYIMFMFHWIINNVRAKRG
jgi:hypothetical protein